MGKKQRCCQKDCKKKLKLTDLKCCKCEKRFCSKHRSCVEHDCKVEENFLRGAHQPTNLVICVAVRARTGDPGAARSPGQCG